MDYSKIKNFGIFFEAKGSITNISYDANTNEIFGEKKGKQVLLGKYDPNTNSLTIENSYQKSTADIKEFLRKQKISNKKPTGPHQPTPSPVDKVESNINDLPNIPDGYTIKKTGNVYMVFDLSNLPVVAINPKQGKNGRIQFLRSNLYSQELENALLNDPKFSNYEVRVGSSITKKSRSSNDQVSNNSPNDPTQGPSINQNQQSQSGQTTQQYPNKNFGIKPPPKKKRLKPGDIVFLGKTAVEITDPNGSLQGHRILGILDGHEFRGSKTATPDDLQEVEKIYKKKYHKDIYVIPNKNAGAGPASQSTTQQTQTGGPGAPQVSTPQTQTGGSATPPPTPQPTPQTQTGGQITPPPPPPKKTKKSNGGSSRISFKDMVAKNLRQRMGR